MRTSSPRISELRLPGGRLKIMTLDGKSSVRQRSDRSSPLKRKTGQTIMCHFSLKRTKVKVRVRTAQPWADSSIIRRLWADICVKLSSTVVSTDFTALRVASHRMSVNETVFIQHNDKLANRATDIGYRSARCLDGSANSVGSLDKA